MDECGIWSALDVIERMVVQSEGQYGHPLCAVEFVFDQLLTRLAVCYADRQHAERACKLFDGACSVLLASGKLSQNEITAYRSLLTGLEEGKTFAEAYTGVTDRTRPRCRLW